MQRDKVQLLLDYEIRSIITLYKEADIRLCMPDVEQDHRIASIASRMTQLNMIDALYVITFNRIGNKVLDQFMETREEALRLRKLK